MQVDAFLVKAKQKELHKSGIAHSTGQIAVLGEYTVTCGLFHNANFQLKCGNTITYYSTTLEVKLVLAAVEEIALRNDSIKTINEIHKAEVERIKELNDIAIQGHASDAKLADERIKKMEEDQSKAESRYGTVLAHCRRRDHLVGVLSRFSEQLINNLKRSCWFLIAQGPCLLFLLAYSPRLSIALYALLVAGLGLFIRFGPTSEYAYEHDLRMAGEEGVETLPATLFDVEEEEDAEDTFGV